MLIATGNVDFIRLVGSHWLPDDWFKFGTTGGNAIWGSTDGLIVEADKSSSAKIFHAELPGPQTLVGGVDDKTAATHGYARHAFGLSRTLIWIACATNLLKYNSGTDAYDEVHTYGSTTKARVYATAADDLWVSTATELWHWNGATWTNRLSELSGSPVNVHSVDGAGTGVYVLTDDGAGNGQLHLWNGASWSLETTFSTTIYNVMSVYSATQIWVGYAASTTFYLLHWNGASGTGYTKTLSGSPTYQAEDLLAVDGIAVYAGYSKSTIYGGVAELHLDDDGGGGWHWRATGSGLWNQSARALARVGGSNLAQSWGAYTRDVDGRHLLADYRINDVKMINPRQDPSFGLGGNSFSGLDAEGDFRIGGQKTIPGGDVSFGTAVAGLNPLAWHSFKDGPPYEEWSGNDPNTVYDVSIPSDDVLKLSMVQSAGALASELDVASSRRWAIPPGDFIIECAVTVPTLSLSADCYLYFLLDAVEAGGVLHSLMDFVMKSGDIADIPHLTTKYYSYYRWNAAGQAIIGAAIQERNVYAATSGWLTGDVTTTLKFKIERSGAMMHCSVWNPITSAWFTKSDTFPKYWLTDYKQWMEEAMLLRPRFQLVVPNGTSSLDARISNLTISGTTPVRYDDSLRLWLPFDCNRGKASGFPDEPVAIVADRRATSFIGATNNKLAWRAQATAADGFLPKIGYANNEEFKIHRIDYHDGLYAIAVKDGTSAWARGWVNKAPFVLIDFSAGQVRRWYPGDDQSGSYPGRAGGVYGTRYVNDYNFHAIGLKTPNAGLGPEKILRMASTVYYGYHQTPADSMPWRCYDGDRRDVAVFRDSDGYAYFFGASTGGVWFTKHRPNYEAGGYPDDKNAAHPTTHTFEVLSVAIDKTTGDLYWLSAAGVVYRASKTTWQAMGLATPSATHYMHGFAHDSSRSFPGTLSRDSQKRVKPDGANVYLAADEGVYRSVSGGAFSLLYGVPGSSAEHEIFPVGVTAVDAVTVGNGYVVALCYVSGTLQTFALVIGKTSHTITMTTEVTDALNNGRATCADSLEVTS